MPFPRPALSRRIDGTEPAPFDKLGELLKPGVANLSQGMVHWGPPMAALEAVHQALERPESQRYTPDRGLTELRDELVQKVELENGLQDKEVMVTAGGNQAFINLVMALCDPGDEAILFTPYYFNHLMAFQMAGVRVRFAHCDPDHHPDLDRLPLNHKTKVVVLVNPANPTGAVVPAKVVNELTERCEKVGAWLISDEPYEYFHYEGATHNSPAGDHVLNLYSFSKSYGMASHRIGYIAHHPDLAEALVKVQDTITVCAPHLGQLLALVAVREAGAAWVREQVAGLSPNREAIWQAVAPLGPVRTRGAFYFLVPLPEGLDDNQVVRQLAQENEVLVAPGTPFGAPGHLRVSYGNLPAAECAQAAVNLERGLRELLS